MTTSAASGKGLSVQLKPAQQSSLESTHSVSKEMASMNNKNGRNGGGNTTLGFTLNPGIQPTGEGNPPSTGAFMGHTDSSQWTVLVDASEDQDHPGMRKPTGFFQPIRHLSGERTLFFILTTTQWVGACKKKRFSAKNGHYS